MSLPIVVAVFRLTDDPRLQTITRANTPVLRMRLAASASRYDNTTGTWETTARVFIDAELIDRGAADLYRALRKGSLVTVEGELVTDEWTTPHNERRSRTKIRARSVHPCASATQLARRTHSRGADSAGDDHDPLSDLPAALDRDGS